MTYYRDRALKHGSISGGDGSRMLLDGLDCWSLRMLVTKLIPELVNVLCWVDCNFTSSSVKITRLDHTLQAK